ncbi:DUF2935 domain-containing protein [Brevibacillus sp. SYP-B805]|uniref:DUF2935 domain-containing protein n=1 Tax=Brevibacillus sp. SYP-B805 TaxID=1578199 RepID=UPI0013ED7D6B|nr:DUF2935 domain-containing protein [Brevibacillus sp. SYP-B805]NGQ93985.1 DUF2935 domain-containing protein [Brevibacillus sp. SYP-B805]
MSDLTWKQTAVFEHQFWLQILGDHARFIFNALPRQAAAESERALCFIAAYDRLLTQSHEELSDEQLKGLHQQANALTQEFRNFKLLLIRQGLMGKAYFPLTFLNHMVNEADEYLGILSWLLADKAPPLQHPIHHHLLWLSDAAAHASGLARSVDLVEKRLLEQSMDFIKIFEALYLKAIEIAGYMRSHLHEFPALTRFNHEAEWEILLFAKFLEELEELSMRAQMIGTLSPLIPDHMAREECYYLTKLSEVTNVQQPLCSPVRPRPQA